MAQDCSGQSPQLDYGYGMVNGAYDDYGYYIACYHDGYDMILYEPAVIGTPGDPALPVLQRTGSFTYDLQELVQSKIWLLRQQAELLLGGNQLLLSASGNAFAGFHGPGNADMDAQAPWAWDGGTGSCPRAFNVPHCWYSFSSDATTNYYAPQDWYWNPSPGDLIVNAKWEAQRRFPALPQLDLPMRYNPYVLSPPDYNTPSVQPMIAGPSTVTPGSYNQWTASASGGVPPYTYQWRGPLTGSGDSIGGSLSQTDDLILDVWDSAGHYSVTALTVTVLADCGQAFSC